MSVLLSYTPWLAAMLVLVFCSAFFSSSEAALFYLSGPQRRRMAQGNRPQRVAAALLKDPERLLSAVLFWNLAANMAYFALTSIIGLQLQRDAHHTEAGSFTALSLLVIILFSEMLPKSLAVLAPRAVSALVSVPLAASVRLVGPLMPALRTTTMLSRRLLFPRFEPEPYLHVSDLERAVQVSGSDAAELAQEHTVLQNIVLLSEIRADELMRPRTRFIAFRPPVSIDDLHGRIPPSGYLLVTEPDSDEVASAIALRDLSNVPSENLQRHASSVVYVPWCTTAAAALQAMRRQGSEVAAVVNEFGETIGILTFDDILDTIFGSAASRSKRLLKRVPIRQVAPGVWHVTGMTSLWRLVRHFGVARPPSKSVSVAGVVQEALERLPEPGDECHWGPFKLKVLDASDRGQLLVELTLEPGQEESP